MANWWIGEDGLNRLKGVEDDSTNLPVLTDVLIIQYLMQYPESRHDYNVLVPTMLDDEQTRLAAILEAHPMVTHLMLDRPDNFAVSDAIQHRDATSGIRLRHTRSN